MAIPKAERGDTGKYTVRLENDSGVAEQDIKVTVLGKFFFAILCLCIFFKNYWNFTCNSYRNSHTFS